MENAPQFRPAIPDRSPGDHPFDPLGHTTSKHDLKAICAHVRSVQERFPRYPISCVEIGSWVGMSALAIVEEGVDVYCVDHWQGNREDHLGEIADRLGPDHIFKTFCENTKPYLFNRIFPCRGTSTFWAEVWPFEVECILIDACHTYEAVSEDMKSWWRHLKPGGLMFGHDYGGFPSVRRAANEFGATGSGNLWWKWKQ